MFWYKNNLLNLHLVENVISFDGLAQWHELIGHEAIDVNYNTHIKMRKLTQASAASSLTSLKLPGRCLGTVSGISKSAVTVLLLTGHRPI